MSNNGYVRLSKSFLSWKWIHKPETVVLFITILVLANYEDTTYEDKELKRGQLITTIARLADTTGLSVKTVRTSISRLQKTGEISVKSANKYTLITVEKYDFYQSDEAYTGKQTANEGQTKGKPTNYIKKQKEKNIYMRFEEFWSKYPKKKSKEAAKKAWVKLGPSDELIDTMLTALEEQKNSEQWTKDNGQFIPYPASWLNGHRWEDEVEVEQLSELEKWARGEI